MYVYIYIYTWLLVCLAYFFDVLLMGACTNMHWQTCGRLVQELNICNVVIVHVCWYNWYFKVRNVLLEKCCAFCICILCKIIAFFKMVCMVRQRTYPITYMQNYMYKDLEFQYSPSTFFPENSYSENHQSEYLHLYYIFFVFLNFIFNLIQPFFYSFYYSLSHFLCIFYIVL